jgi:hypothetical protein
MDLGMLLQGITLIQSAVSTIKQIIDALPDGARKQEAVVALENAERHLKIGEAQTAQALGHELCRKHFPPEIMLSGDDVNWKCPACDNEKYTGPVSMRIW